MKNKSFFICRECGFPCLDESELHSYGDCMAYKAYLNRYKLLVKEKLKDFTGENTHCGLKEQGWREALLWVLDD